MKTFTKGLFLVVGFVCMINVNADALWINGIGICILGIIAITHKEDENGINR